MRSQTTRVKALENTTRMIASSDAEILRLFVEPWERGDYDHVAASWQPGQAAIKLAECAWLAYVETEDQPLPFEFFIQSLVEGTSPEFL